ncbi:hypothetical protein RvVAR031_30580 [Agrobacterium vitis]|nr:hypothetical protein RvVAR031_30580 [Agrobacterium vitis]
MPAKQSYKPPNSLICLEQGAGMRNSAATCHAGISKTLAWKACQARLKFYGIIRFITRMML